MSVFVRRVFVYEHPRAYRRLGDVIIYACGFASDAAAKKAALKEGATEEEAAAAFEPMEYCLSGAKDMLQAVRDKVDATRSTIFLSHPVNYREAMYPDYKANRDVSHKPHWYDEIKDYLLNKGAIFSDIGDEADDALGIGQTELMAKGKDVIICTNDKDLDMIPGLHYNWSKTRKENGVYVVDPVDGLRSFYTQLITGDSTDNIPGIYRKKGIRATAQLKGGLDFLFTEQEMYQYVLSLYDGDEDFLRMIGPLLWIKRKREDGIKWEPPV